MKFLGKFKKKKIGRGVGLGGQGGCERRNEFFVEIQKNNGGGVGGFGRGGGGGSGLGGFRVDVNEEVKFLGKFTKKIRGGGSGGSGWEGVRMDVNEELKFL